MYLSVKHLSIYRSCMQFWLLLLPVWICVDKHTSSCIELYVTVALYTVQFKPLVDWLIDHRLPLLLNIDAPPDG